jgi:hypothetical protein
MTDFGICLFNVTSNKRRDDKKGKGGGVPKRGRPKLTWAEGIRGMMGEKGVMEEDWADRGKWRKKII